jgi:hypothetical protein
VKKLLLISIFAGFSLTLNAQKIDPKFTFNVELGLPIASANFPFKTIMQGLVSTNVYGQYSFPFHLNVGLGIKYSYFTVNEFSITNPIHGGMHSGGAFVKVGYDKFYNDRFAMDYGVKIGYMENFFLTDANKALGSTVSRSSSLIEPTIGVILTADERNSYRLNLGYVIQGFSFQPTLIGLDSNSNYEESKLGKITQYFYVGFGYTFYFGIKGGE